MAVIDVVLVVLRDLQDSGMLNPLTYPGHDHTAEVNATVALSHTKIQPWTAAAHLSGT